MKRSVIILISSVFYIAIAGCGNDRLAFNGETVIVRSFPHSISPEAESVPIECLGAMFINIVDSLLLIDYGVDPEYYFAVYNMHDYSFLKNILRRGRGPSEFLMAAYFGQYNINESGINIYVNDLNKSLFSKVNLTKSLLSLKDYVETVSSVSPDEWPKYILKGNRFMYGTYKNGEISYQIVDEFQKPVSSHLIYKNVTQADVEKLGSSSRYNSVTNKIASGLLFLNQLNIIDLERADNIGIIPYSELTRWNNIRDKYNDELTVYYNSVKATDDLIFALYVDQPLIQCQREPKAVEIHVFDWNGKGVSKIRLAEYIQSFDIDEAAKTLYGIDNEERIFKYDISDIFL